MRVLITGLTGMAGSFLAEYLVDQHPNAEVFGTFRVRIQLAFPTAHPRGLTAAPQGR